MSDIPRTNLPPSERVDDLPRMLDALRRAIQEALLRHKRDGQPVAVWRNARVEWVQPEDIPDPSEAPVNE